MSQPTDAEFQKSAADLGFDVTRQFLTIAFSGIAFVVGVFFSSPEHISPALLWWIIGCFAGAAAFGLLVLMRGVQLMGEEKSYDINTTCVRLFAGLQILLVIAGAVLLCVVVAGHSPQMETSGQMIEIRRGDSDLIRFPIVPEQSYTIEVDPDRIRFSSDKNP